MASPMTSMAVVEVVGASPKGSASLRWLILMRRSAFLASVDVGLPVIAMMVGPITLMEGRRLISSKDSPLLDKRTATS